jgi:NADH-quinone oxidoreductase subunit G
LYKQRVWWLTSANSVCPGCSTGCSVHVDQNDDKVYRLRPRSNPASQGDFMCDEGRFGWKYLMAEERLALPEQRERGGKVLSKDWDIVLPAVHSALTAAAKDPHKGLAAVLSPWMTLEEAYLLAGYLKSLATKVTLALRPVHVVGEDDRYPKDLRGKPLEPTKFTIRAEKCPNRRGVEIILNHFAGGVTPMGDVLGRASAGDFAAVYLAGGDPNGWISDEQAGALDKTKLVIVQDILPSAASRRADFVLAGGSFAERDGTFVNHAGLAQEIHRSIHGPGEARPDGRIFWELSARRGMYQPNALRREMGQNIPALAALGAGALGEFGVKV